MQPERILDVAIVGGGIGGVISLKYARDAGLQALIFERRPRVGGLWAELPAWQDIQFRKEDWTLGGLPIDGEHQASILANIEAWVERFDLASCVRTGTEVRTARPLGGGWELETSGGSYRARALIAASGGHNRPVVPEIRRSRPAVKECHSSQIRDPAALRGKRVVVVGGGASAFDLLELAFANEAASVAWVYRSVKWMRPTLRSKYSGTDMRLLARHQMLGMPLGIINRLANRDLDARYKRFGLGDIRPAGAFDLSRHQMVPGRPGMIRNFARIERYRGEVRGIEGRSLELTDGRRIAADLLLWATGYATDLQYLQLPGVAQMRDLRQAAQHCRSLFRFEQHPQLFFLAPGVLETNTSTPWAYAHAAKSIVSCIRGRASLDAPPSSGITNNFDIAKAMARVDRASYPPALWYLKYLRLALFYPRSKPMPIP